jgi:hypothetical protein
LQQATIATLLVNFSGAAAVRELRSRGLHTDARRLDRDRNEHQRPTRVRAKPQVIAIALLFGIAALCLAPRDARADFDFQFATNLNGGWMRQTPTFSSKAVSTSAREMRPGTVQTGRSLAMVGLSADVDLTIDDRWKVPLIGGSTYWAVGSYDSLITSLDGSIASVRPWSMFRGDLFLPGVGRRWKQRRNMWGIAIRTGVSFASIGGAVAAGTETVPLSLTVATFLVQAELEACRRLDPSTRICLQVVPRLYEHELLNGVTFGLRMEWGR